MNVLPESLKLLEIGIKTLISSVETPLDKLIIRQEFVVLKK
jgi:hypothetical protein